MKFINLKNFGDAHQLFVDEMPAPAVQAGEVLIQVSAAGVNRPDILQRQGRYPAPKTASPILGLEVAGVIEQVGPNVTQWKVGERVCALVNGGGYAEAVTVPAGQVLPIPGDLSFVEAASLPETYFTVWGCVFKIARLRAGESFLVHGGTSGIGTTAIQLARHFGARVFATAGGAEKREFCLALGADVAIDYRAEDFVQVVQSQTQNTGVQVILDMVGGDYFDRNLRALAPRGRLVQIAFLQGPKVSADITPILTKGITVTGSTLRPQSSAQKAEIAAELKQEVWPLFAEGKLRPIVYKVFPWREATAAHLLMETSQHKGKIVLELN